jgi:hypothetical protein
MNEGAMKKTPTKSKKARKQIATPKGLGIKSQVKAGWIWICQ